MRRQQLRRLLISTLCMLGFASTAGAMPMQVEVVWGTTGGGTVTGTGTFDGTGFTGVGLESFFFSEVTFVFSNTGASWLRGNSYAEQDMFGVQLLNGGVSGFIDHNNVDVPIFSDILGTGVGFCCFAIEMDGNRLFLDPPGFFGSAFQRYGQVSATGPVLVPEPQVLLQLAVGFAGLLAAGRRRRLPSRR